MRSVSTVLLAVCACTLLVSMPVGATLPQQMNYQGRTLEDGTVTILPLLSGYEFFFDDTLEAAPGSNASVYVQGRNVASLKGYSVNLLFDPAALECTGVSLTGTRGQGAVMFIPAWGAGYAKAGIVYSYSCPPQIDGGAGPMLRVDLHVRAGAPLGPTYLDLADVPPALNRMTLCDGSTQVPDLLDGVVMIGPASGAEEPLLSERGPLGILYVRPNPSLGGQVEIAYRVAGSTPVDVTILDVTGRVMRVLRSASLDTGTHRVLWDGLDDQGLRASSGVYFIGIDGCDAAPSRRLLLVR